MRNQNWFSVGLRVCVCLSRQISVLFFIIIKILLFDVDEMKRDEHSAVDFKNERGDRKLAQWSNAIVAKHNG